MRRIKAVTIIGGGVALSSLLLAILIQAVLAAGAPPPLPHEFAGNVSVGNAPAGDGLEIRVKAFDVLLQQLVPLELTPASVDAQGRHLTQNSTYGDVQVFQVPQDDPDTPAIREGAKPLERLSFFIVPDPSTGIEIEAQMIPRGQSAIPPSEGIPFEPGFTLLDLSVFDLTPPVPPVLVAPVDGAVLVGLTVDFEWQVSVSPDVASYRLQVASGDDVDFSTPIVNKVIPDPSATGDRITFTSAGQFRWRVGATDVVGNETVLADLVVRTFTVVPVVQVTPPGLVAPPRFTNAATPLFQWTASQGTGITYSLQVVRAGDQFAEPFIINIGDIPQTSFTSPVTLADDTYSWRVIASDSLNNSATSQTGTFSVDTLPPTIPGTLRQVTPDEDASARTFSWDRSQDDTPPLPGTAADASGVDFYRLDIAGPENLVLTADDSDVLCPAGVCTITTPDLITGSYAIEVNAVDRATNESAFTDPLTFRAGPRTAPPGPSAAPAPVHKRARLPVETALPAAGSTAHHRGHSRL